MTIVYGMPTAIIKSTVHPPAAEQLRIVNLNPATEKLTTVIPTPVAANLRTAIPTPVAANLKMVILILVATNRKTTIPTPVAANLRTVVPVTKIKILHQGNRTKACQAQRLSSSGVRWHIVFKLIPRPSLISKDHTPEV